MSETRQREVLLLTLVHPDFLPPVYAVALTLRDSGYAVRIVTFDSFVPTEQPEEKGVVFELMGKHHGVGLKQRLALRRKFADRTAALVKNGPLAVISFCTFSYLTALKHKGKLPIMYFALEIADYRKGDIKRSPLSAISNYRALKSIKLADFVATPSVQRSAWLAGRCHIEKMPHTIINSAYYAPDKDKTDYAAIYNTVVPPHFKDKKVVLYTGAVNDTLCVANAVKAFDMLGDTSCALVLTGMKENEYCNSIRAFVSESKLKDNILLLPYVKREEMLALQACADIGIALYRETDDLIDTYMIAPNKVGEYLAKGLYLLGTKNEFMRLLEAKEVAALADTPAPADVRDALRKALHAIADANSRVRITTFVEEFFCMQQQAAPIVQFLNNIK